MQQAISGAQPIVDRGGRRIFVVVLLIVAACAWIATIVASQSSVGMHAMPGGSTALDGALFAGMWLLMMVAMMFPSATPMVLMFRNVQRQRGAKGRPVVPVAIFIAGYLIVWLLAGLGADLIYGVTQAAGAHVASGSNAIPYVGGAIIALAGLYQFTPLKYTCLSHCRSPLHLVMHGWRDGYGGAWRMGATHGFYCLGCCWGIMAVLFVVGLMNLGWMAALSLLILAEKVAPRGMLIGRFVGALFIGLGAVMAVEPRFFPASGLTPAGQSMAMGAMPGGSVQIMKTTPMATGARQPKGQPTMPDTSGLQLSTATYRASAGSYSLTLMVGLVLARHTPTSGSMTTPSSSASGMSMGSALRQLDLLVVDSMGMPVTVPHVAASLCGLKTVALTRRDEGTKGMQVPHYRAAAGMASGPCTVTVHWSGYTAAFHIH